MSSIVIWLEKIIFINVQNIKIVFIKTISFRNTTKKGFPRNLVRFIFIYTWFYYRYANCSIYLYSSITLDKDFNICGRMRQYLFSRNNILDAMIPLNKSISHWKIKCSRYILNLIFHSKQYIQEYITILCIQLYYFIRTCKYLDNKYYLRSWLLCSRLLRWISPKVSMMVFNAIISFSGLPVGRGPKEVMLSKCFLALLATNPIVYQSDFHRFFLWPFQVLFFEKLLPPVDLQRGRFYFLDLISFLAQKRKQE